MCQRLNNELPNNNGTDILDLKKKKGAEYDDITPNDAAWELKIPQIWGYDSHTIRFVFSECRRVNNNVFTPGNTVS